MSGRDGLYDADVLAWSEQQAGLLRRLEAGEKVNAALDWANVIEEIESVGRRELRTVESDLTRLLEHLIKLAAFPDDPSRAHWRTEAAAFRQNARRAYANSMKQKLSLESIMGDALELVEPVVTPQQLTLLTLSCCPYTQDELLDPNVGTSVLVDRLALV